MNSNRSKYDNVFASVFEVDLSNVKDLKYQGVPEWDSVGHMSLMGELEDAFNITMLMEDIIDFSSYEVGLVILNKYDIIIEND